VTREFVLDPVALRKPCVLKVLPENWLTFTGLAIKDGLVKKRRIRAIGSQAEKFSARDYERTARIFCPRLFL
jgi:hypothetical protein